MAGPRHHNPSVLSSDLGLDEREADFPHFIALSEFVHSVGERALTLTAIGLVGEVRTLHLRGTFGPMDRGGGAIGSE